MNVLLSSTPERAKYNRVRQWLERATQMSGENFVISRSDLRLEAVLDPNKDTYEFEALQNPGADRPLEKKLNRNDMFFVSDLALCITMQDTSASPAKYGNFPLFTYPDPDFFDGVASSQSEWECLETIYNGTLTFATSVLTRIPGFSTHNFRYVPETQYASGVDHPQYGPGDPQRGYYSIEPMLVLDGLETNKFTLKLGAGNRSIIDGSVDSAGASVNTRNVVVLLAKGFVVSEGAKKAAQYVKSNPFV